MTTHELDVLNEQLDEHDLLCILDDCGILVGHKEECAHCGKGFLLESPNAVVYLCSSTYDGRRVVFCSDECSSNSGVSTFDECHTVIWPNEQTPLEDGHGEIVGILCPDHATAEVM